MVSKKKKRAPKNMPSPIESEATKEEALRFALDQIHRAHGDGSIMRLGDSASLDVLLYAFVETPDWSTELREKHRLFADILRLAEKLNVNFAFPTQTIHLAKPEDLEHPDRPESDLTGADLGRSVADEVVEHSMAPFGGDLPPPVVIQTNPVAAVDRSRRFGSEDEDGG